MCWLTLLPRKLAPRLLLKRSLASVREMLNLHFHLSETFLKLSEDEKKNEHRIVYA